MSGEESWWLEEDGVVKEVKREGDQIPASRERAENGTERQTQRPKTRVLGLQQLAQRQATLKGVKLA